MAQGDVETYYEDGQWKNRREGAGRAFGASYASKDEAVTEGGEAAARDSVEHIIKRQDGRIGEKNSHGNDPRNVPVKPQRGRPREPARLRPAAGAVSTRP